MDVISCIAVDKIVHINPINNSETHKLMHITNLPPGLTTFTLVGTF